MTAPPISTEELTTPAVSPAPTERETPPPAATSTPTEAALVSPTPTISEVQPAADRHVGQVDGVTFVVSEGSEATFTVEEQLARLPIPNDAVLRTTALKAEVHLDGRPSAVEIDLHQLTSDQAFRDRYVHQRMFPQHPIATFEVGDLRPLPDGFAEGKEVKTQVGGVLFIGDGEVPLTFDVQARDDGGVVFVLGRTDFTWSEIGISAPQARPVVWVDEEVHVEVLLALSPVVSPDR